jgi:thioredoxin reductase (NADPH)
METIGADLRQMQHTPLADEHVAAIRVAGTVVNYPAGAFLTRPGDTADRFTYVEAGEV